MSQNQMRLAKFLPSVIFALVSIVSIMAGWLLGTYQTSSQYPAEGGIRGGLLGLVIGSFLGFGSFGIATGWIWRQRYPNIKLKHFLLLTLGWMVIPIFILLVMLLLFNF